MDSAHVADLTAKFSEDSAALKEALEPLVNASLNDTANKLPVLDRAKLYTLAAYSLESILFSNLRLSGTDAKSHPIFTELQRVQQYFGKIKDVESGSAPSASKPSITINKAAVHRLIKHELAANSAGAQGTKRKFDDDGNVESPSAAAVAADETTTGASTPAAGEASLQDDTMTIDEPGDRTRGKKGKKGKKQKKDRKGSDAPKD